jgi:hypothetical protein
MNLVGYIFGEKIREGILQQTKAEFAETEETMRNAPRIVLAARFEAMPRRRYLLVMRTNGEEDRVEAHVARHAALSSPAPPNEAVE